ncbi:lipoyl domain-containing protein [Paraburkholderia phymatum]|uniref:lipoyl domain-containing protein n=1 Tax=Paraburkholderia phymatum TaxID=148447 RepID=UPI0031762B55
MTTPILLPKIGFSMNEGTLVEWLVPDGSAVSQGDPIYALESEKAVNDIEAPATGTLKIQKLAGESYEVGTVLGEIL